MLAFLSVVVMMVLGAFGSHGGGMHLKSKKQKRIKCSVGRLWNFGFGLGLSFSRPKTRVSVLEMVLALKYAKINKFRTTRI